MDHPNLNLAVAVQALLYENDRGYAWLSRTTGVTYKAVLAEVSRARRPMTIPHASAYAAAFGMTLGQLIDAAERARITVAQAA